MVTRLIQVMALLYKMQPHEIKAIEEDLLERRKQAWRTAIREEARRLGCGNPPRDPSGNDLRELKAMSKEDAKSIADTYNKDIERQLQKLFDANPRSNRQHYISGMERYLAQRSRFKSNQVALNTVQQTRGYATQRFYAQNGLRGKRYLFTGPAPVCRVCTRHFAAGLVDQAYVDRYPNPQHINCSHEWVIQTNERLDCAEIWVG